MHLGILHGLSKFFVGRIEDFARGIGSCQVAKVNVQRMRAENPYTFESGLRCRTYCLAIDTSQAADCRAAIVTDPAVQAIYTIRAGTRESD